MEQPDTVLGAAQAAVNRNSETTGSQYVTDALMVAATIDADGKRTLRVFWSETSPWWTLNGMAAAVQRYSFENEDEEED